MRVAGGCVVGVCDRNVLADSVEGLRAGVLAIGIDIVFGPWMDASQCPNLTSMSSTTFYNRRGLAHVSNKDSLVCRESKNV